MRAQAHLKTHFELDTPFPISPRTFAELRLAAVWAHLDSLWQSKTRNRDLELESASEYHSVA
jgi:hypothetical protein